MDPCCYLLKSILELFITLAQDTISAYDSDALGEDERIALDTTYSYFQSIMDLCCVRQRAIKDGSGKEIDFLNNFCPPTMI